MHCGGGCGAGGCRLGRPSPTVAVFLPHGEAQALVRGMRDLPLCGLDAHPSAGAVPAAPRGLGCGGGCSSPPATLPPPTRSSRRRRSGHSGNAAGGGGGRAVLWSGEPVAAAAAAARTLRASALLFNCAAPGLILQALHEVRRVTHQIRAPPRCDPSSSRAGTRRAGGGLELGGIRTSGRGGGGRRWQRRRCSALGGAWSLCQRRGRRRSRRPGHSIHSGQRMHRVQTALPVPHPYPPPPRPQPSRRHRRSARLRHRRSASRLRWSMPNPNLNLPARPPPAPTASSETCVLTWDPRNTATPRSPGGPRVPPSSAAAAASGQTTSRSCAAG